MSGMWRKLAGLIPGLAAAGAPAIAADDAADRRWQEVYTAREQYYRSTVGEFPQDILKLGHMVGVWPGGGLFALDANKLGKDLRLYTTFGLSNPDMPTSVALTESKSSHDDQGRLASSKGTLAHRTPAVAPAGAAGYGYEFIVVSRDNAEWPLWILQWACNAEILNDAGFLARIDKYHGMTVEQVQVGRQPGDMVNLLITRARAPLPTGTTLPNGRMDIVVATVITEDEMQWSMQNGREALLEKLQAAGVGQVSNRTRRSVLN